MAFGSWAGKANSECSQLHLLAFLAHHDTGMDREREAHSVVELGPMVSVINSERLICQKKCLRQCIATDLCGGCCCDCYRGKTQSNPFENSGIFKSNKQLDKENEN